MAKEAIYIPIEDVTPEANPEARVYTKKDGKFVYEGKTLQYGGGSSAVEEQKKQERTKEQQIKDDRAQKEAEKRRIEKERREAANKARKEYQETIRYLKDKQSREAALKKYKEDVRTANVTAGAERVEAGLITGYTLESGKPGTEIKVTKDTSGALSKLLKGEQITVAEAEGLKQAGLITGYEVETVEIPVKKEETNLLFTDKPEVQPLLGFGSRLPAPLERYGKVGAPANFRNEFALLGQTKVGKKYLAGEQKLQTYQGESAYAALKTSGVPYVPTIVKGASDVFWRGLATAKSYPGKITEVVATSLGTKGQNFYAPLKPYAQSYITDTRRTIKSPGAKAYYIPGEVALWATFAPFMQTTYQTESKFFLPKETPAQQAARLAKAEQAARAKVTKQRITMLDKVDKGLAKRGVATKVGTEPVIKKGNWEYIGTGKETLTKQQQKVFQSELLKTGITKKEASRIISQGGIYKQTIETQLPRKLALKTGAIADVTKTAKLAPLKYSKDLGVLKTDVYQLEMLRTTKAGTTGVGFTWQAGVKQQPTAVKFFTFAGRGNVGKFTVFESGRTSTQTLQLGVKKTIKPFVRKVEEQFVRIKPISKKTVEPLTARFYQPEFRVTYTKPQRVSLLEFGKQLKGTFPTKKQFLAAPIRAGKEKALEISMKSQPIGFVNVENKIYSGGIGTITKTGKITPIDTVAIGGQNMRKVEKVAKEIITTKYVPKTAPKLIQTTEQAVQTFPKTPPRTFIKISTPRATSTISQPAQSIYYGTGQYERTVGGLLTLPSLSMGLKGKQLSAVIPIQSEKLKTEQQERVVLIPEAKTEVALRIGTKGRITTETRDTTKQLPVLVPVTPPKEISQPITETKIRVEYPNPRTPSFTPQIPKKPIIRGGTTEKVRVNVIPKIKTKLQAYTLQIRRRGKFFDVKQGLPYGKALKLGAGITRRTLAATFKLVPKGETESKDIKFTPSPEIFRIPKNKAPFTYIQKRGFRLSARSEVGEIQRSRGRLKWL